MTLPTTELDKLTQIFAKRFEDGWKIPMWLADMRREANMEPVGIYALPPIDVKEADPIAQ